MQGTIRPRIRCGLRAAAVIAGVLVSAPASAQLAASANDSKLMLREGAPAVVPNAAPDSVTLLDLSTRPPSVLRHIEAPTSVIGPPTSVALTPDEGMLFVTSAAKVDPADPARLVPDNRLTVIDLKADPPKLLASLEAGAGASGMSITRDGRLALVANRYEGTVSVFRIQGTTVSKIDTVTVGTPESGVAHVAVSPDARLALVTRDGDHAISVLSISGDKVAYTGRDFGTGLKPYGAVITEDSRMAIIANLGYARGDSDTISIVDLTLQPLRVVETYSVGQTPEGIALSPDGKMVAVVTMNGSNKRQDSPFYSPNGRVTVYRIVRDRLQYLSSANVGAWPQGAVFSADSRTLAVQSMADRSVWIFEVGSAGVELRDTGQRLPLPGGGAALRTAQKKR